MLQRRIASRSSTTRKGRSIVLLSQPGSLGNVHAKLGGSVVIVPIKPRGFNVSVTNFTHTTKTVSLIF